MVISAPAFHFTGSHPTCCFLLWVCAREERLCGTPTSDVVSRVSFRHFNGAQLDQMHGIVADRTVPRSLEFRRRDKLIISLEAFRSEEKEPGILCYYSSEIDHTRRLSTMFFASELYDLDIWNRVFFQQESGGASIARRWKYTYEFTALGAERGKISTPLYILDLRRSHWSQIANSHWQIF